MYFDKCVDGHDRHVGLTLGVVHQIQIDKLLELKIVRLHAIYDVRKQGRHIFADSHRCDHLQKW